MRRIPRESAIMRPPPMRYSSCDQTMTETDLQHNCLAEKANENKVGPRVSERCKRPTWYNSVSPTTQYGEQTKPNPISIRRANGRPPTRVATRIHLDLMPGRTPAAAGPNAIE